jgi:co-chaperonin GroES (HSP10)
MKLMPVGPRIFVEEITPTDDIVARASAAGLHAVVLDENKPMATEGIVVAIGTDPLIREIVQEGDHVFFNRLAGNYQYYQGKKYRVLTVDDITSVEKNDGSPTDSGNPYSK